MESSNRTLGSLKQKLAAIADVLSPRKKIIYIDYPLHRNIGDLLINSGTEQFFDDFGYTVKRRYNLYDLPLEIPDVEPDDAFVFHGGGNLGDLYPDHLNAMANVVERFPNNQIVQFPQTVYFSDNRQRELRAKTLRSHSNLTIYVRDTRSLDSLQEAGIPNVFLMPDMAHQLYGQLIADPAAPTEKNLYFFRTDVEGGGIPSDIAKNTDHSIDWDACIRPSDRLTCALLIRAVRATKLLGHPVDVYKPWYHARDNMIQSGIQLLSKAEVINTNRLHAMLLAVLIGRDVAWFDNTYGKLSSYVQTWLQGLQDSGQTRQLHAEQLQS